MPGNTTLPTSSERGGIDHLGDAGAARQQVPRAGASSSYCWTSVRACPLKSRPILRAVRDGQQALAEQQRRWRPCRARAARRRARTRRSRSARRRRPRRLGDDHVDRRPGQRQQRAGVRAERQRQQQLRRRPAEPHGHHHDDGHERGDRAVDVDQRRQQRHQRHRQDDQPRPALARRRDQLLPRPRGDPGRVEPLADDEQRRDEDHRRIAEPRERLLELEHPGRPQRERDAERDDRRRHAVPDEHHHGRREDDERDRRRRVAQRTGQPGPTGMPIRYQAMKNSVHRP